MSGHLLHPVSQVIRQLLIDLSLGEASGNWPIFFSNFPDTQDQGICVYDTNSQLEGRLQDSGETQERHGIQIRVRTLTPSAGFLKARAIAEALDTQVRMTEVTVQNLVGTATEDYLVQNVSRTSDILPLGTEGPTQRRAYTINFVVNVRLIS